MTTIIQLFGVRPVKGDIGLEIEVDGCNLPEHVGEGENWLVTRDGSVKGGREYVLSTPSSVENLGHLLRELWESMKGSRIKDSYKAGVHVHVNVQDLTPKQLFNYICAYIIVEEVLIDWCKPSRQGNHFCFRAKDAEYLIHVLSQIVMEGGFKRYINDQVRYSGVNICSLPKYGSLEFRSLESTQDFNKILTWVKVLKNIQVASQEYEDPRQMLNTLSAHGSEQFARKMLGEYAPQFLVGNWAEKVREGVILAQDVAFSRDWEKMSFNIFKRDENIFN